MGWAALNLVERQGNSAAYSRGERERGREGERERGREGEREKGKRRNT